MSKTESLFALFPVSKRAQQTLKKLEAFIAKHDFDAIERQKVEANKKRVGQERWTHICPIVERLKVEAKAAGLWNLFLPKDCKEGAGFTNVEYAFMCELMGRWFFAAEVFNCSAPDTGNMEVLVRYGNKQQKREWLEPLLNGEIRSCFAMTEPAVASSDATNIETEIRAVGNEYVVSGRKWWTSGAGDPRCKLMILMGRVTDAAGVAPSGVSTYRQQSMILIPMDAPGIEIIRPLSVFGFDDSPHGHCEIVLNNVRVPKSNMVLGEGRGFEIAQGRLGPGRLHHCMRSIGAAERALELHCDRAMTRRAFGKLLAKMDLVRYNIALSRQDIDSSRLLTLLAAVEVDQKGGRAARGKLALAKLAVPTACANVIDRAIQVHGGAGVSSDFPMAYMAAAMRTLRLADGPDEVHARTIGLLELKARRNVLKGKL